MEGIVSVAFLHIDQIQNLDVISFLLQKISGITQNLTFRIQHHITAVALHDIGLAIESRLTGT